MTSLATSLRSLSKRQAGGANGVVTVEGLDKQARHLGVTRQSLIKLWIAERLQ